MDTQTHTQNRKLQTYLIRTHGKMCIWERETKAISNRIAGKAPGTQSHNDTPVFSKVAIALIPSAFCFLLVLSYESYTLVVVLSSAL